MVQQVSIPEDLTWNCPSRQQIIRLKADGALRSNLPDRLISLTKRRPKARNTELVFELPNPAMLETLGWIRRRPPKVRVLVSDDQLGEIHRSRARFNAVYPTLVLDKCRKSLPRAIQFLASLNLPIEVSAAVFMEQDEESLLDLAERLLFSPLIKTPVQPFFTMLMNVMGGENSGPFTLWDTYNEKAGQSYFITEDGEITLSKRWADNNRFFGKIPETLNDIRSSRFFRELLSIKKIGSITSSDCANCLVVKFCAGYLRALDATYDCSSFVSFYNFMWSHASSIKENFLALPNQKQREIFQAIAPPVQMPPNRYSARRPKVSKPTSAILFVSSQCDNNCIFCAPADKRRLGSVQQAEKINKFIILCASQGVKNLMFSGAGEPTLNPNLPDFVATAKSAGIKRTTIVSNGTALSKNSLTRLKTFGNDALIFSLHGIDGVHDSIVQREGSFTDVLNSMNLARKMDMEVGLNTVLVKENLTQVAPIFELGKDYCTLDHTLAFPEWSGNALKKTHLLPSYQEAYQFLIKLDWPCYPHVALENFPRCVVPAGARRVKQAPVIKYLDLSRKTDISTALNFGNNILPECCKANKCRWLTSCIGVDKEYFSRFGAEEFTTRHEMQCKGEAL